ncbi:glycoside hydrolase family 2 TIM barrel-domain containing protein [uncultured Draconibacterium sp.]|uniref:glycoside hydrolase family 2 protein n=1 Tax=uncultured Draconibacterium sp. TaxID=1573823 RepID=UPI00325FEC6A
MNKTLILILISIFGTMQLSAQNLPEGYPQTQRTKQKLNSGWKFHLGDAGESFYTSGFDDSDWEEVNIPHTLKLTTINLDGVLDDKTQPTFHREVGWYRKTIKVGANPFKKVFLEFEGAHQVTDLWVNGKHVGQHVLGGYTPFIFDVSDVVNYGEENQVTLLVDNRVNDVVAPDPGPFDYIKFSGLYRDVYLVETDCMRITFNIESINSGVTITTPSVDPVNLNATINIKTAVKNESKIARTATVVNRVIDQEGFVVLKLEETQNIVPGAELVFNQIGGIEENVQLWDVEHPYLYKVNTLVLENGVAIDAVDNPLGIRKFELDPEKGFKLNGKVIELIGYNRHQHYGYIGDAMPNSLHYKDMLDFKNMGFNVMRCAHYPHDDEIMRACDELGILVYEEAPTWISISQKKEWYTNWEQAARVMVRNHRNHPSVVIWGAGINHRGAVPQAHYAIKQEDPTRLTASQSSRWTGWQTSWVTDIYANMNYGPVMWERNEPLLAMEGGSGPEVIAQYKRDPMMPGMISWVAHAYYTFHDIGNFDDRTRAGMWDSFRYIKRQDLMWYPTELKDTPMIYFPDQWEEGIQQLTIYSNCPEIELFVNDNSIGKYRPSSALKYQGLDHPPYEITVKNFEPGKLTAKGLQYGKVIAEETIYTPGKPAAIRFWLDNEGRNFVADGSDILVGHAEVVDANGMIIRDSEAEIKFEISGDAKIVGDTENIGSNPLKVKRGGASVLIQAGKNPGKIMVTASSQGLKPATASVQTIADETNMVLRNAYSIYDFEKVKVDMGAADQLLQFGWLPWNGNDNETSEIAIKELGGFKAEVKTASGAGVLRWLGEMNVIGKYGFVYGEGVLGIDDEGLELVFSGLTAGKYKLKSYHHAPRSNTDSMDPNREKLKTVRIHTLPYARSINARVNNKNGQKEIKNILVSEGQELQFKNPNPGHAEVIFETDGSPVSFVFSDDSTSKGVWLNGFELSEQ